jgi:hypothetical protein
MLVIRDAQLAVLKQGLIDRFLDDLVKHLQTNFAEPAAAVGGEDELREFARRAIEKSAGYGIETRGGMTTMAELMVQFGENLQWSPLREWTFNILETPRLPGHLKIETIRDRYVALTGGRVVLRP